MFEVRDLTKVYSGGRGIQGLNLTVRPGEVVALLGPNGAGKTTAMQAMAGWVGADKGLANWNGVSVHEQPERTKSYMGLMIGEPSPYRYLSGLNYLKCYDKLYPGVDAARIQRMLELVGLSEQQHAKIKTYSTGMKQRLELASALLHQPKLLLLDEPFSGMDIEGRRELSGLLRTLSAQTGLGIIVSSHQVRDIEDWMTHCCIIYEGRHIDTASMEHIRSVSLSVEDYYVERISAQRRASV